jgi:hypothetical protein
LTPWGTKTKTTHYNIIVNLFSSPRLFFHRKFFAQKKTDRRWPIRLFTPVSDFLPDAIKPQGRVTVAYAATVGAKTGI